MTGETNEERRRHGNGRTHFEDLPHDALIETAIALAAANKLLEFRYKEALTTIYQDELTGVLRRSGLQKAHDTRQEHKQREKDTSPDAAIMIDIDKFKTINDTRGHDAGDNVLREVAGALRKNVREEDIIGRYGGDEFIVCLPSATLEVAKKVAERISDTLAEDHKNTGSSEPAPTLSIGIAKIPVGARFDEMLPLADRAMYEAKHAGGDQIYVDNDSPQDQDPSLHLVG